VGHSSVEYWDLGFSSEWSLQTCALCNFFFQCLNAKTPGATNDLSSKSCLLSCSRRYSVRGVIRGACESMEQGHWYSNLFRWFSGGKFIRRLLVLLIPGKFRASNIGTKPWRHTLEFRFSNYNDRSSCFQIAAFRPNNWRELRFPGLLADLPKLKDWLDRDMLVSQPNQPHHQQTRLTVINCSTRCLVSLPHGQRYATLSYVWGTVLAQSSLQNLPAELPQTIEDSIRVCCALSIQYIWIDRYCIPQDDPVEKSRQILQMTAIYQNSYLTIVACAGKDPKYGLPGISMERHGCPSIYLQMPPDPYDDILESVWAKRGWTYQEALSSSRRVYFTHQDMFFESANMAESEFTSASPVLSAVDSPYIYSPGALMSFPVDIYLCITNYTPRSLSDQSDALNAILGIFASFETKFNVQHLHGLPYIRSAPIAHANRAYPIPVTLEQSLRWEWQDTPVRRVGFPTWSWAGWVGKSGYPYIHRSDAEYALTASTEIAVEIELSSGKLLPWTQYLQHKSSYNEDTTSISNFIHLDVYTSSVGLIQHGNKGFGTNMELELKDGKFGIACGVPWGSATVEGLENCDRNLLLAIHMLPSRYRRKLSIHNTHAQVLVIKDVGKHWERVALFNALPNIRQVKMTRRKIRLG
jgi:hypothetical protein